MNVFSDLGTQFIMRLFFALLAICGRVATESGSDGWLRYGAVAETGIGSTFSVPSRIVVINNGTTSGPLSTAVLELQRAFQEMFGKLVETSNTAGNASRSLTIGTTKEFHRVFRNATHIPRLLRDGFWLNTGGNNESVTILAQTERGALYGAFEYLSLLARGNFSKVEYSTNPTTPIRWINQWDNLDGSIERGYSGPSIFFKDGEVASDLSRVTEYARLLASVRINGVIVNNVNANASLLTASNIEGLGRLADAMRPYGVQLGISLNFASPTVSGIGNLTTYDPLNPGVIAWWTAITSKLYARIPDMAGYLVKANSEGQPGPLSYNRTLADGANMFANTVKPFGGVVMFRAFVYDNHLSEANWKNDRAKAAVDFFDDLDGKFNSNVVVQIKYGPMDFQVREPTSPLFAHMRKTRTAIELQVTQEYLGQQSHFVYLPPLWKTVLDFDLRINNKTSIVRDTLGGFAAVVNVGTNTNWLGHHLAMSNLFAYGRLAWNPTDDPVSLLHDWTKLTFGLDPEVLDVVTKIAMQSWPAYENYTGNLGMQTLTDILYTHFGPNAASHDNNGWGMWTRADRNMIGMDRTVKNGTGFSSQYPLAVAKIYENIETTPDELLLWFHHVNYTYRLRSNKTVIQHIYDAHYDGAETAEALRVLWESVNGKVDQQRYDETLYRLSFQAGHAIVWRDAICGFYRNLSVIEDDRKRIGNHPWRVEAESMELDENLMIRPVQPVETASNGTAVVSSTGVAATAQFRFPFANGTYNIAVNYFDLADENTFWRLFREDQRIAEWSGNNEVVLGHAMSVHLDGHSATRITFYGITLEKGDLIRLIIVPNGKNPSAFDYMSFFPSGVTD